MTPTVADATTLLNRAGVPWVNVPHADWSPIWDGRRLNIAGLNGCDIVHDLAHWLVCAPSRRRLPNYGLGEDYRGGGARRVVSFNTAECEEIATCLVDISILARHGWGWRDQADYYSLSLGRTVDATARKQADALALAVRRGLMTAGGMLAWEKP